MLVICLQYQMLSHSSNFTRKAVIPGWWSHKYKISSQDHHIGSHNTQEKPALKNCSLVVIQKWSLGSPTVKKKKFANFFWAIYNFRVKKIAHMLANVIFMLPGSPAGKAARNDSENILLVVRSDCQINFWSFVCSFLNCYQISTSSKTLLATISTGGK